MTKRNLTLGTASGKLGSVVYFRRRGQQITRVLVSSVNDRRSLAQCRQRAHFANSVALWRLLRPYIGVSWRGVSRYGSPENAFYHHNRGLMPTCSKNMSRAGNAFPCLGIITYGSLPVDIPLTTTYAVGTGSYTGIFSFNMLVPAPNPNPGEAASLFMFIQMASQGIEDGDIIHIVAMAYGAADSLTGLVESAEQHAPRVYHAALSKSMVGVSLHDAAPWLRVGPARTQLNEVVLGFDVLPAYWPDDPDHGFVDFVMTMFVERPNNPPYARFSRSRFIGDNSVVGLLRNLCNDTEYSDLFAETFRNV